MKKMKLKTLLLFSILLVGCSEYDYFKNVGDLPFDESLDDKNFEICNKKNIKQYYVRSSTDSPANYEGEKRALEKTILSQYNFAKTASENGYLTIRFLINCKGETGRFRIEEMNFEYQPIQFDQKISEQLLKIVKNLDGWIPRQNGETTFDFYQYLTFKIQDGQIIKILP